jgi:hypothetical protein
MKCRVGPNGPTGREGFGPHESMKANRTIGHCAVMAFAFVAGIEMDDDVAAMKIFVE